MGGCPERPVWPARRKGKGSGGSDCHTLGFCHCRLRLRASTEESAAGTARQARVNHSKAMSTYSDVGPDVGGRDYGAPRRPVRGESLDR